jgi:NhaP-type Na+/H+ or K+/H+ antiporter
MIGLLIGAVVRELNKRFNVPYTPLLFVIGLLLGYYKDALGILGDAAEQVSNINPHGILMIFLPPLIFESGFNSDWHIFRIQTNSHTRISLSRSQRHAHHDQS